VLAPGDRLLMVEEEHDNRDGYSVSPVHLWSVATGQRLCSFDYQGTFPRIAAVAPDGRTFVGDWEDCFMIWNASSCEMMERGAPCAHGDKVYVDAGETVAFIVERGREPTLYTMGISSGDVREVFGTGGTSVEGSLLPFPDGERLAVANRTYMMVRNLTSGELLWSHQHDRPSSHFMALSPDGNLLAVCTGNGVVQVWDLTTQASWWCRPLDYFNHSEWLSEWFVPGSICDLEFGLVPAWQDNSFDQRLPS